MPTVRATRRGGYLDDGDDGTSVVEFWTVDGLSAFPAGAQQYQAKITSGVPQKGEGHPYVPNVYVRTVHAEHKTPDAVALTITWTPRTGTGGTASDSEPVILRLTSGLVSTTTEVDRNGDQITVAHTYLSGARAGATDTQGGSVELQLPQIVAVGERREQVSPRTKAMTYTGAVNAVSFNGSGPRTWLCDAIEGDSADGGETYMVSYRFIYRADTWDARLAYIDPETGQRPPDLLEGVGLKVVRVRPELDFGPLNVVMP